MYICSGIVLTSPWYNCSGFADRTRYNKKHLYLTPSRNNVASLNQYSNPPFRSIIRLILALVESYPQDRAPSAQPSFCMAPAAFIAHVLYISPASFHPDPLLGRLLLSFPSLLLGLALFT